MNGSKFSCLDDVGAHPQYCGYPTRLDMVLDLVSRWISLAPSPNCLEWALAFMHVALPSMFGTKLAHSNEKAKLRLIASK